MNFKYFLNAKIDKQLARGRLLAWQMWFQMYEFDVEWIPGNSNFLADALTREMNKAFGMVSRPSPFYLDEEDSLITFVKRWRILQQIAGDLCNEIKKIVGLRIRRNQWIQNCQAWQAKNIGPFLGLDEELVKVYPA